MPRSFCLLFAVFAVALMIAGCGNPIKRDPANVFPGSEPYAKRVAAFKIKPDKAYELAHEAASTDNKLQFLSKRPTVIAKRWYVFSMPQPTGAILQGYHVNGDNGEVKFVNDKTIVKNTR